MGVDVASQLVIRREREEVAAYAGNPDNAPDWYANITSVEWRTVPPLQVGSRVDFVATFLGRRLAYTYEIVALTPGERLVMRTAEGPFLMETSYSWESAGTATTRMTLRNRGEPRGFARALGPFLGLAIRYANAKDLRKLRQILERRSTPAGPQRPG